MSVGAVYHYSEDGSIRRFAPQVVSTNPSHPPGVWAIDQAHSPLYWFPRDCPRVSVWANSAEQQELLTRTFASEATRILATETGWIPGIRSARLYRYTFDATAFAPCPDTDGQYVADQVVHPTAVELVDDLLALHAGSGNELRFTPRLGELTDRMLQSGLPFGFVRIRNAVR